MYYTKVIFNASNAWYQFEYGFKINMLCGELEITYNNFEGGYNTKKIKLNNRQHEHLKLLLNIERFEKLRDSLKKDENLTFLDPHHWSLQCISNDENPILEIPDIHGKQIKPPDLIINLVKYITKIGIERSLLKRMRFF